MAWCRRVGTWLLVVACVPASASDCVVLLHGLIRSAQSMAVMAEALEEQGYRVANVDYPSRQYPVETLAPIAVEDGVSQCRDQGARTIHFVTHSMGGILVRFYLEHDSVAELGRVVMLAPPNRGSEVVDTLKDVPGFDFANGPAGAQLGTGAGDVPAMLGPVTYPVGIIAGTATINPILSQYLPNPDDGKVSVASTKVDGMTDFIAIDTSHPFIMRNTEAVRQAIAFLASGKFDHDAR
jgi:hypothetical protein